MKKLILILCIAINADLNAQPENCYKEIIKDIKHSFIPPTFLADTCYHFSSLLVMEVNEKSELINVIFSDNAPKWMVEGLEAIKNKIDMHKINKRIKENGIKNIRLIFPLTYQSVYSCIPSGFEYYPSDDKRYFTVNGKLLTGNIQFCKPEVIGIQRSH